ncbi:DUF3568 family protein [bacterium]|nr:DUF3568 family protein [bacterium]
MRRWRASIAIVLLPFVAAGCIFFGVAGVVGATAYVWKSGWLQSELAETCDRVHMASRSAARDVDLLIDNDHKEEGSSFLDCTDRDGRRVMIKLATPKEGSGTIVRIRVGFWGDKELSVRILDRIRKHL